MENKNPCGKRGVIFMKVTFESKGRFENARNWLKSVTSNKSDNTLHNIAKEGERALTNATPRDTGETAYGWTYSITKQGNISEIAWMNTAHPNASVNVAKIIELGHGTGTGGYVAPRPYIVRAMDPVFRTAGDKLAKGLK